MEIHMLMKKDFDPAITHVYSIPRSRVFDAMEIMKAHGWDLRFLAAGCVYCTVTLNINQSLALTMNGIQPIFEPDGALKP